MRLTCFLLHSRATKEYERLYVIFCVSHALGNEIFFFFGVKGVPGLAHQSWECRYQIEKYIFVIFNLGYNIPLSKYVFYILSYAKTPHLPKFLTLYIYRGWCNSNLSFKPVQDFFKSRNLRWKNHLETTIF